MLCQPKELLAIFGITESDLCRVYAPDSPKNFNNFFSGKTIPRLKTQKAWQENLFKWGQKNQTWFEPPSQDCGYKLIPKIKVSEGIHTSSIKNANKVLPGFSEVPICQLIMVHEIYWKTLSIVLKKKDKATPHPPFPEGIIEKGFNDAVTRIVRGKKVKDPMPSVLTMFNEFLYLFAFFEEDLNQVLGVNNSLFSKLLPVQLQGKLQQPITLWVNVVKKVLEVETDNELADRISFCGTADKDPISGETVRSWRKGVRQPNFNNFRKLKLAIGDERKEMHFVLLYRAAYCFQKLFTEFKQIGWTDEQSIEYLSQYRKWYTYHEKGEA